MADVMEPDDFIRLKRHLLQVEGLSKKDKGALQKQMLEMDKWSFLHYLSYLVYRPNLEALHLKLMEPVHKYLPEEVMFRWEEKIKKKMERQLEQRKQQKAKEQSVESEEDKEEALIQKAISAN